MNTRRIAAALAIAMAAGTVALAGCGSSDTASTAATTATTATTAATSTTGTTTSAAARTVACVGAEEACSVKIPLGGGASNERIAVELTGTDMGEPKVVVGSEYTDSYSISDAQFTTGGSVYEFTLNAVESIPEGVNMELTFAQEK